MNFEMLSQHRNSKGVPKFKNYAFRKELWQIQDLPDSQIYNHPEQTSLERNNMID
jgi:hypothetical protein